MIGVNMVFFVGGPQLGEIEAGAVANWFGAPFSVITRRTRMPDRGRVDRGVHTAASNISRNVGPDREGDRHGAGADWVNPKSQVPITNH